MAFLSVVTASILVLYSVFLVRDWERRGEKKIRKEKVRERRGNGGKGREQREE